jgi:phage terminase small subunit
MKSANTMAGKLTGMAKTPTKTAEKRALFVREYLIDRNGTRAAIAAGFAKGSAAVAASRLLRNAHVQEELAKLARAACDRLEVTLDRVLQETAKLAYADMGDYIAVDERGNARLDLAKMKPHQTAAIQEITEDSWTEGKGEDAQTVRRVKLKLTGSKQAALEMLRKHLTGDDEIEMTPEQRKERLNYLLAKAGFQPKASGSVH